MVNFKHVAFGIVLSLVAVAVRAEPTTNPSPAAKVIADLKAENKSLREELAVLKKQIAELRSKIPVAAPGGKVVDGMNKEKAAATLEADGWALDFEKIGDADREAGGKCIQQWTKTDGDFELRKEVVFFLHGKQWMYGKQSEAKTRK